MQQAAHFMTSGRSLLSGLVSAVTLMVAQPAHATLGEALLLLTEPIDIAEINEFREGSLPDDGSVITEGTISQSGLTVPSLWWAQEQFGGKLLDYWVAHLGSETPRRVDLVVNQQVWVRYTYLERYEFISHFGTSASDFGFSTRVFDWQGDLLAAYICEFEQAPEVVGFGVQGENVPNMAPQQCQVFLDSTGIGAVGGTTPLNVPLSTDDDIDRSS